MSEQPPTKKFKGETVILKSADIVELVKKEVMDDVKAIKDAGGPQPCLAVVLVGERPDSQTYVRHKKKLCGEVGIKSVGVDLPASSTQAEITEAVRKLNADRTVHGILVQLPLPDHVNATDVLETISPFKDVDGLTKVSAGRLVLEGEKAGLIPCTPLGCLRLLDEAKVPLEGANAVVLGRSNLVGKPMASLLLSRNATVTICHSRTKNLPAILGQADVVVAAIGKANFVKGAWLKHGAVLIDVGINSVEDKTKKAGYRLVGDADYDECVKVSSVITPVPGGVGPMTVAMLLRNTIVACRLQTEKK